MKKLIFFIINVFISLCIYSQDYERLVDTNKVWSSFFHDFSFRECGNNNSGYQRCDSYYHEETMLRDTMIEDQRFMGVYINNLFYGTIREDTIERKVFMKYCEQEDRLLYDFSLMIGQEINSPDCANGCTFIVDSIDNININNKLRKRIMLDGPIGYEIWIEGIGSLNGLTNSLSMLVDGGYNLLCMKLNDTIEYVDPEYNTCYYDTMICGECIYENSIAENYSNNSYVIYPNPVIINSNINIDIEGLFGEIEIFDLVGELIVRKEIKNNSIINLSNSKFKAGLYVIKLKINENIYKEKLIIVAN
jgi:hypothetical protein